jgi:hypothetical protein
VLHLLGHHRYLCTRHRIWIGPPDQDNHPQPSLDELPEVIAAQHAHLRLLHRLGPAATYDAVLTGFALCAHLWAFEHASAAGQARENWDRRAGLLIPPGTEAHTFSPSRLFAATYPEAVSLATLTGSLHWRRLAAGTPTHQRTFTDEFARRLGLADHRSAWTNISLINWIDRRSGQPPALPRSNYSTARTFGGKSHPQPSPKTENARTHAAHQFARNRVGGTHLLVHRALVAIIPAALGGANRITKLRDAQHLTAAETTSPTAGEPQIRPTPVLSTFLNTATEPVPWTAPDQHMQPTRPSRPWFPGN